MLAVFGFLCSVNHWMKEKYGYGFKFRKTTKTLRIKKLFSDVKTPRYGSKGSAGLDIYAYYNHPNFPFNGEVHRMENQQGVVRIPTGLSIEIPEDHVGVMIQRSSVGLSGVIATANIIDSDYRNELFICYQNISGKSDWKADPEKPIAQMLVLQCEQFLIKEVQELSKTDRDGGFGSTDKKKQ